MGVHPDWQTIPTSGILRGETQSKGDSMDKDKMKAQLSTTALGIAEKCVVGALAATGITTMVATDANATTSALTEAAVAAASSVIAAAPSSEGAILLDIMRRDPATGVMVADHYSHASHASHESHSSHYSSR